MRQSLLLRKPYDLVQEDGVESKDFIPDDELLQHGVQFTAKYVGSMEVPRPSNRAEIVTAMRTIRFEFKERGVRKTKVAVSVSTSGVTVVRQKKKHRLWRRLSPSDDGWKLLLQHPVHRIFYVSHDSQDLKIFSYIACDSSALFRCHVFKAYRKTGAMQVVRTIGRAFDVCHRLTQQKSQPPTTTTTAATTNEDVKTEDDHTVNVPAAADNQQHIDAASPHRNDVIVSATDLTATADNQSVPSTLPTSSSGRLLYPEAGTLLANTPVGVYRHQLRAVREKLRLEVARSEQFSAEAQRAREQLKAETDARITIHRQAEQLLEQNRQLLDYIGELVACLGTATATNPSNHLISPVSSLSAKMSLVLSPSATSGISSHLDRDHNLSPDSGHREFSSDSPSTSANAVSDSSWHSALAAANTTYLNDLVSRLRDTTAAATHAISFISPPRAMEKTPTDNGPCLLQFDSPARPNPGTVDSQFAHPQGNTIVNEYSLLTDNPISLSTIDDLALSRSRTSLAENWITSADKISTVGSIIEADELSTIIPRHQLRTETQCLGDC